MSSRVRKSPHGWSVKLRTVQGDHWFAIGLDHEAGEGAAEDRRKRLQRLANLLKAAGRGAQSRELIVEAAAERSERDFRKIEVVIEGFSPDAAAAESRLRTFRDVAEYYASGRFQDDYPDSVKKRKGAGSLSLSAKRLEAYYPVLGLLPFDRITDALIDQAKRRIPKVEANTRRAYLQELRRVLRIAVRPLKLVTMTPDVEVPAKAPRKQFLFLYPENDHQLVSNERPPFARRFLYAYLSRTGRRISEVLLGTWRHVDLKSGTVRVEAGWTKTGLAQFYELDADVLEALRLRHASLNPAPSELVFLSSTGRPMSRRSVLRWMIRDLKSVGLDVERPELIEAGPKEQTLRLHDLSRSTFVTLTRAMGRHDRWIMDRTGHDSASSFEIYDRLTRSARERNLGWLAPMGRTLGMRGAVSLGPSWAQGQVYGVGQSLATDANRPVNTAVDAVSRERHRASITEEKRQKIDAPESPETPVGPRGQPGGEVVGQSRGQSAGEDTDPVDRALAFALEGATKAGAWDAVIAVTQELAARRRARTPEPGVVDMEKARQKRERNGEKP